MRALRVLGIVGLFFMAGSVPADAQVINEILADPWHLPGGDANGDNGGAEGHFIEDEFVEIYNNSGADLDMSGWEIQDNGNSVHVLPPGTVVADQCAIVVFGGGTPTGAFGGAVVQTSSTGNLSLSNSGATISLVDAGAVEVVSHTYDGDDPDTGQNTSITRDPDITGGFVQHITATDSGAGPGAGLPRGRARRHSLGAGLPGRDRGALDARGRQRAQASLPAGDQTGPHRPGRLIQVLLGPGRIPGHERTR